MVFKLLNMYAINSSRLFGPGIEAVMADDLGRLMYSLPPFEVLGKLRASALLVKHLNCESHLKIWLVLGFVDAASGFAPFCYRDKF